MAIDPTSLDNPSAQPALVEMWRSAINKARQEIPPQPVLPSVITINFDGGGQPLVPGLGGLCEITFPCRLLSCHMYAGTVSTGGPGPTPITATVVLGLTQFGFWSTGATPLPNGDPMPSLVASPEDMFDVTNWIRDFQPGDVIAYGLTSVSGTATFLTVTLPVRRIDVTGIGVQELTDSFGSVTPGQDFTSLDGSPFTIRG